MKKFITVLLLAVSFLISCEDYLDKSPDMGLTQNDVFTDYQSYRGYLDRAYKHLRWYHFWDPRGVIGDLSDEAQTNQTWTFPANMNSGSWNESHLSNSYELGWDSRNNNILRNPIGWHAFKSLRITNMAIENIGQLNGVSQKKTDQLIGQAYFLRSWYYFQLIKRWGGMPKFDQVYSTDDDLDLPRMSYHESTDWMIAGLDKAIQLLPEEWPSKEAGRATKGAAMALKSVALLYDASPLMNPDKGYQYDIDRCKVAAEAAWKVLELAQEGLYQLHDFDDYEDIFYSKNQNFSDEAIWAKPSPKPWNGYGDLQQLYIPISYGGAKSVSAPTQNLVDMFEMANGLPIDDPNSGYDPQEPYKNRDPRFYKNILYNGAAWGKKGSEQLYIETYQGGREDKLPSKQRSHTGYFNKKFWPAGANKWQQNWDGFLPWNYIRLAQIYLDFAEAANEAYGPTTTVPGTDLSAVDAVNIIRNRANMPNVAAKFTGSKQAFRKRIRNERAVELSFENKRWHDIRRWHIAKDKLEHIYKVIITKNNGDVRYRYTEIEGARIFNERNYWYPIPKNQANMLDNFEQNPGW